MKDIEEQIDKIVNGLYRDYTPHTGANATSSFITCDQEVKQQILALITKEIKQAYDDGFTKGAATEQLNSIAEIKQARKPLFTKPELTHLISLINSNEREGSYYAPKEQYWKRSERIKDKLLELNKD